MEIEDAVASRVAVIGCPGSGKSTFARKLADKTGLPLIHLDYYYHQAKYDYPNHKPEWFVKVREMIAGEQWIIDGNYSSTMADRFAAADVVLWFDLPRRVVLYRLFKRRLQYHGKVREDMPDDWREKISWEFLKFVWQFNTKYRRKITDIMAEYPDTKVIRFTSQAEADKYLEEV